MKFSTHRWLLALTGVALSFSAVAQNYPNKPVNLMIPYPAGGLSDIIARSINVPLAKQLNQPVIIENLGGVSGAIAAQKVLAAPSDGYYIFQGSPNELILAPLANAAVKLKSEDFRPVQILGYAPIAMFVRKDLPANNADELVAYAQKMAKEGKPMTYASVGIGSFYHLLGEHLSQLINTPMTHVPYKGGADVFRDLIGGQVDLFITPYGAPHVEYAKTGRLKIIAAVSNERQPMIKEVPTLNEGKALKGFAFDIWSAYFVKKDTPEEIVQTLNKAIGNLLLDPDTRTKLENIGQIVPKPMTLSEVSKFYADNTAKSRAIAKSINLQPQ